MTDPSAVPETTDRDAERPLTDRITEVLVAHEARWMTHGDSRPYDVMYCATPDCDWSLRQKTAMTDTDCIQFHRAHVAAVLADLMGDGLADTERAEAKIRELRERCYNDHRFTNENAPDVCDTCGTERK